MRILVTADTIGGVWIYTRELVTGLLQRGHSVILASFGKVPLPDQNQWMCTLPSAKFQFHPTEFPLEWMQYSEAGIADSFRFLADLISETKPDILHSSQFCYGALDCGVPKIVVAHSDVVSWWKAVHGNEPPHSDWFRWYVETVTRGLAQADSVVAPSEWMLASAKNHYRFDTPARVIYNGRDPKVFEPSGKKQNVAISVGRLWDQGKQANLLLARRQSIPVQIVGPRDHPEKIHAANHNFGFVPGVELLDSQSEADLSRLLSQAAIYVATSRYEPFGLAPVEAAFSKCALVANDLPVFHELWGDCAVYFGYNDPGSLAEAIREVSGNPALRDDYAERAYRRARSRFDSRRMVDEYESLYHELASKSAAA
ncbi:MAG: glycosyltransferase family 4 protein [Acidobacteriaceae bacterium]|nr:glycosyltransferase family 4 protein [Acidobacteriaceae bacterium]